MPTILLHVYAKSCGRWTDCELQFNIPYAALPVHISWLDLLKKLAIVIRWAESEGIDMQLSQSDSYGGLN